jgi:hypothetical protein
MSKRKVHGNISHTRNHEAELAFRFIIAGIAIAGQLWIAAIIIFGGK